MTQHILLVGAGFSRNWGGWLADEAFEFLLGDEGLDPQARAVLWSFKEKGGFEDALAHLQNELVRRRNDDAARRLEGMQGAIERMFMAMDAAFSETPFEPSTYIGERIAPFLARFDAIFSLNQDTLLERHYFSSPDSVSLVSNGKWNGHQMPGTRPISNPQPVSGAVEFRMPLDQDRFQITDNLQPFIKLYGSWNWRSDSGQPLMVLGGNKSREIMQHKILSWNFDCFTDYLSKNNTSLMVIGYSFRDEHVDKVIFDSLGHGLEKLFIVDPSGVDVIDRNRDHNAFINAESSRFRSAKKFLIGASRRSLISTFSNDHAERGKLLRFFH